MIVDRGHDFPIEIENQLVEYGRDMWAFREQPESGTARALNSYLGEHRKLALSLWQKNYPNNSPLQLRISNTTDSYHPE